MKICHACKGEQEQGRVAGRRDVCRSCRADLTCCLNCAFYDRAASRQCREPLAELVQSKERANFCDYFSFADTGREVNAEAETGRVRKALDDLFKK